MTLELCHGCGVVKDRALLEPYPYHEAAISGYEPIEPLIEIDCSPRPAEGPWRQVTVCHECCHRLDPDMWISQACWERLAPFVPFDALPLLEPR